MDGENSKEIHEKCCKVMTLRTLKENEVLFEIG